MSSSFGRSIILSIGAGLVVVGAVLMATELAVGLGASLVVWGLAAVSYRFTAAADPDDQFAASPSARKGQMKVVL